MPRNTEEVPTVNVEVRLDGPYILLAPRDDSSTELLQRIVDGMPDTMEWHFQGSKYKTPSTKDVLIGTSYACGGTRYDRREGNVTWSDYRGAIKVHFDLTGVDRDARYAMRNYGYFSSVTMEPDSTAQCLRLRAGHCKVCNGHLSRFVELEWRVCDSCSAVCTHLQGDGGPRRRHARLPPVLHQVRAW